LPSIAATMTILGAHLLAGALSVLLAGDPFALLTPHAQLSAADRQALAAGAVIARTFESGPGHLGVFSIMRADVAPEALIVSARRIEDLRRGSFVTGIGRFSDPPRLEDLASLRLTRQEVAAAAACRPRSCSFKVTHDEIAVLQRAAAGKDRDEALQAAFRGIVLARVKAYVTDAAQRPLAVDHSIAGQLDRMFKEMPKAETFLYWSQETYGAGKPVVVVTHVGVLPPASPGDPAIVLGKQVMATHYMDGGLSMMSVTTDQATGVKYLTYLNRTSIDLFGGIFGGLKRAALESRLKRELPSVIQKLRTRLQNTPVPARP
jgi:hypothetical protein